MLKRSCLTGALALCMLAHSGGAYAASVHAAPGDPPAGSPSGQIYELPFEKGRSDAAPKGSGGTSAGGGGAASAGGGGEATSPTDDASVEPSLYRSENNFGSSSQVPGNPSPENSASGGEGNATDNGHEDDAAGGATGTGSSNGGGPTRIGVAASGVTGSGNTSPAGNFALLGVIALIAVAVGAASLKANRLRAR